MLNFPAAALASPAVSPIHAALSGSRGDVARTHAGGDGGGLSPMAANIELFRVLYQPSLDMTPVPLLCQSFTADEEKLLWIDGINEEEPVLIPLSCTPGAKEWVGSFFEFMDRHHPQCSLVVEAAQGQYAPIILVRAVEIMVQDDRIGAELALEMAYNQGCHLLADDQRNAEFFRQADRLESGLEPDALRPGAAG